MGREAHGLVVLLGGSGGGVMVEVEGVPPVRYATSADGVSLAFMSFGRGATDFVIIPPFAQNIELSWERPELRRVFERLGSFARVVLFDKRERARRTVLRRCQRWISSSMTRGR